MTQKISKNYTLLLNSIGEILQKSREKAYLQVNQILVQTYWEVGKYIVEYEQQGKERATYGSKILESLSQDLTQKYGAGFSTRSLSKFRQFYTLFPIWSTVSAKLSWSHYCLILRLESRFRECGYFI